MDLKKALIEVVGKYGVLENPSQIKQIIFPCSILEKPALPKYIVLPSTTQEIQKILYICNELGIPLTPVSSEIRVHDGSVPLHNGIVLNLKRMNRIISIDLRNRNITVEPGVTWGMINSVLKPSGMMVPSPLFAIASQSVLTSSLEREPRLIPKFEYGEPISSLEMIWPTGEIFRTGSASSVGFPHNFAEGCYPYGPGPLDPLRLLQGAQGTMGIVTWAKIKIEQRPCLDKVALIPFQSVSEIVDAVYTIQKRRIGNECFLINRAWLSILKKFVDYASGEGLTSKLPPWALILILSAGKWFPEEKIKYQKEELWSIRDQVFPFTTITGLDKRPGWLAKLPDFLRSALPPSDPTWIKNFGIGVERLFFLTTLEKTPLFVDKISKEVSSAGFQDLAIGIYIQPIDYCSAVHLEFTFFSKKIPKQSNKPLRDMLLSIVKTALALGGHFTRPYGREVSRLVFKQTDPGYMEMLKRVKSVVDPANIMNPGKLCL